MTDANLVKVLQAQIKGKAGLVDYNVVRQGPEAIKARFAQLKADGCNFAVPDALTNDDLMAIGAACADMPLVTAGSGIALGLPQNFRKAGLLAECQVADALPRAVCAPSSPVTVRCCKTRLPPCAKKLPGLQHRPL